MQNTTLLNTLRYSCNSQAGTSINHHLNSHHNEFKNHKKTRNRSNNLMRLNQINKMRKLQKNSLLNSHSNHKTHQKSNRKFLKYLSCSLTHPRSIPTSSNICSISPNNQKANLRRNTISNLTKFSFTSNSSSKGSNVSSKKRRNKNHVHNTISLICEKRFSKNGKDEFCLRKILRLTTIFRSSFVKLKLRRFS